MHVPTTSSSSSSRLLQDSKKNDDDDEDMNGENNLEMSSKLPKANAKTKRRSQPKVKGSASSSSAKSVPDSSKKKNKKHSKKSKTTTTKKKKKNGSKNEKYYWSDDSDKVIFSNFQNDENCQGQKEDENTKGEEASAKRISKIHFKVRGNPRPLRRHRTSRGFTYNPSQKFQQEFYDVVKTIVFDDDDGVHLRMMAMMNDTGDEISFDNPDTTKSTPTATPATNDEEDSSIQQQPSSLLPLFDENEILIMTIIFRLRRPRNHFIGNKAAEGVSNRMRDSAPHFTSQTRTDIDNLIKFVLDSLNLLLYEDDRQIMSIKATKILDDEGLCEGSTEIVLESIHKDDVRNELLTL